MAFTTELCVHWNFNVIVLFRVRHRHFWTFDILKDQYGVRRSSPSMHTAASLPLLFCRELFCSVGGK